MEAICNRAALLEALQVTSAAITPRTPKPALQCVLMDCQEAGLAVVATDLQVGIRYRLEQVEVKEAGQGLVPADRFLAIVRECPDDTLCVEIKDNVCKIDH